MEDKSLSVPCPTCGSRVGQRCVLSTDQPRTNSHYERSAIAKDHAESAKAARKMAKIAKDSSARHSRDLVQMQRVLDDVRENVQGNAVAHPSHQPKNKAAWKFGGTPCNPTPLCGELSVIR